MNKLKRSFYLHEDVVSIAKDLLGKVLVTNIAGVKTSGIITETEAYKAPEDKASHAFANKKTKRTETMFAKGGRAYVYLCYGMHHLFNIVTGPQNLPHAVLIRALRPLAGVETMQQRRDHKNNIATGPAILSQALGITTQYDNADLLGKTIWLEDHNIKLKAQDIKATKRIGIDYAEEYKHKLWRFLIENINTTIAHF